MKLKAPDEYRFMHRGHPFSTTAEDGMNGCFVVPLKGFGHKILAYCIVSNGWHPEIPIPWEHVSVHILEYGKRRMPTWDEMCAVKDVFWDAEECVIQYHPPKSEYVNIHPNVLHLWKFKGGEIPRPPKVCV